MHVHRKPKIWRGYFGPYVVGDPHFEAEPTKRKNTAQTNAKIRRPNPTTAEAQFERILNELGDGALKGRFVREWAFADKWILDFFFPEIRLGIEIDGPIHSTREQQARDAAKSAACVEWNISLIRFTNHHVLRGEREILIERLRDAWRLAKKNFDRSPFASLPNASYSL